ncbi:hypothetical protein GE061_008041 [Apolygus lucorum]|uniref:PiggyBac transposable element-derived protein domain-containing protein n=1 Tax=Apolygus lucorum TaxID=248454 RepID=A0A8S9WNP4_APOLU|nr:hypothetical protein GE061_008041 [Apolygus lucorum]
MTVDCPNVIQQYNSFMGRVDLYDENIGSLRVTHNGKKWWYLVSQFGIGAACKNAWQLYKATSNYQGSTEMDVATAGVVDDPEALLNAWLGELDNLTLKIHLGVSLL